MLIATINTGSSPDKDLGSDADSDVIEVKKDECDILGYAYVGSHNFTPSAWGTLSGSEFTPILNVDHFFSCQFSCQFFSLRHMMTGDELRTRDCVFIEG
jgi:hypothetical protein